jgi:chemotaxis response regulator CheB
MSSITKAGVAAANPVVRVLLVDDSAVARGMEARALQNNPMLSVVGSVSNGQMAVDFVGRNPVDVIVLDLEMPVMDGLTAIPKLLEKAPQAKIIVVSALTTAGADVSLKCLRAGATDVIAKPSSVGGGGAVAFAQDLVERVAGSAASGASAGRSRSKACNLGARFRCRAQAGARRCADTSQAIKLAPGHYRHRQFHGRSTGVVRFAGRSQEAWPAASANRDNATHAGDIHSHSGQPHFQLDWLSSQRR